MQPDINRETPRISALWPGKIDKYKYLTGDKILPSDQIFSTFSSTFKLFPLGKIFEKQKQLISKKKKQKKKRAAEKNKLKLSITNKEVSIEDVIPNIISRREILYVKW